MHAHISALPELVKTRLAELTSSLKSTLGAELGAILVHGSVARGEYREGESDVDVMLVLERDAQEQLQAIGPALKLARFSARIEVMILRRDEIPRASDCFPLLYEDIARTSVVLAGDNPFANVHIHGEHKRLRIEQELREARIRLRRVVSDMAGEPSFGGALERKIKQLRAPLRALLALHGREPDERLASVLDAIAALYELDLAPLRSVREDAWSAYATLTSLLERALVDVDEMPNPSLMPGAMHG